MINPSVYFFCKNKDLYQSITLVSPYLPYIFVLLMQLPGVLALEVTDAWSFQGNVGAHVFYIIWLGLLPEPPSKYNEWIIKF